MYSRPVIGHTVSSGLRLTGSKHGGMGFCSLGGLISAAQVYHVFMVKERKAERVFALLTKLNFKNEIQGSSDVCMYTLTGGRGRHTPQETETEV